MNSVNSLMIVSTEKKKSLSYTVGIQWLIRLIKCMSLFNLQFLEGETTNK